MSGWILGIIENDVFSLQHSIDLLLLRLSLLGLMAKFLSFASSLRVMTLPFSTSPMLKVSLACLGFIILVFVGSVIGPLIVAAPSFLASAHVHLLVILLLLLLQDLVGVRCPSRLVLAMALLGLVLLVFVRFVLALVGFALVLIVVWLTVALVALLAVRGFLLTLIRFLISPRGLGGLFVISLVVLSLLLLQQFVSLINLFHFPVKLMPEIVMLVALANIRGLRNESFQYLLAPSCLQLIIRNLLKTTNYVLNDFVSLGCILAVVFNAILKDVVSEVALHHLVEVLREAEFLNDFILDFEWSHVEAYLNEL